MQRKKKKRGLKIIIKKKKCPTAPRKMRKQCAGRVSRQPKVIKKMKNDVIVVEAQVGRVYSDYSPVLQ